MKNFSSILTLLTVATLVCPMTACAVGKASENELSSLTKEAYELGADTDYIGISSFKYNYSRPVPYHVYEDFLARFDMPKYYSYEDFVNSVIDRNVYNTGMSILNILAHNGIIKPSDIDKNAENMADISYSENVGRIITSYESITAMPDFYNYTHYLKDNFTYEEQVDRLVNMAEKNENGKRYFLISYNYTCKGAGGNIMKSYNNVTGIGIAEGNWNFNDIDYDKCILTLDPNSKTSDGLANGFDESYCIYINSETKECYIPAYKAGGKTKNEIVFASIDDDTFFNYKGLINPSEEINTDVSNFWTLTNLPDKINEEIYFVNDGKETLFSKTEEDLDYDFSRYSVLKAESFHHIINGGEHGGRTYRSADRLIDIYLGCYYPFVDMNISNENIYIKNISYDAPEGFGHEPQGFSVDLSMNKDSYNFAPYYNWTFNGETDSDLNIKIADGGILLSSAEKIHTSVFVSYHVYNDVIKESTGETVTEISDEQLPLVFINSARDVFVKVDENKEIRLFVDDDNDGVFDDEVKTGDVNMDGVIDAADASEVLAHYSYVSIDMHPYYEFSMDTVSNNLGDVNNDGFVDAIDASEILSIYSKSSTGK